MSRSRCILHTDTNSCSSSEVVKDFTESTWEKVKHAASFRLKRPLRDTSKYWQVCRQLGEIVPDTDKGYHVSCYKHFTAISEHFLETEEEPESNEHPHLCTEAQANSAILESHCIFCNKVRKKRKGKELLLYTCEYDNQDNNIKEAANILNDAPMLTKIHSIGSHTKEIRYHHICKRAYLNRAQANAAEISQDQQALDATFIIIINYVQNSIIDDNRPEYLTSLHQRFCRELDMVEIFSPSPTPPNVRSLGEKIENHFEGDIMLSKSSRRQGLVVSRSNIPKEVALKMVTDGSSLEEITILEAARHLRSAVMNVIRNTPDLPQSPTLKDFCNGQAQPPDILLKFFETLYNGPKKEMSEQVERQVKSVSQDVVYAVSKGHIKTSKHLCIGFGIKSLTGSRRILEILNRLGHSVSYHCVEELESEMASSLSEKVLPDGLLGIAGLSTGLAWDNYDELCETLSGHNTLHDTVGICYQNQSLRHEDVHEDSLENTSCNEKKPRRSRTYESKPTTLMPFKKKNVTPVFNYKNTSTNIPSSLSKVQRMDKVWMTSCALNTNTPMWRGWNSKVCEDILPRQVLGYMQNIELPATRLDVVQETLKVSQKVAERCSEKYAIVHYDLAMARLALDIQTQMTPTFDNIFICFGPFHIEMAYFAALGYLLEGSGGPMILSESEVLAVGSMNGFISGKHFNRCKRLHPLFAGALQTLHFKEFMEQCNENFSQYKAKLETFSRNPTPDSLAVLERTQAFVSIMSKYELFCETTRKGGHGATAQFWITYIDLVHLYLLLDRSCRTNDLKLFMYALEQMTPVFFATHRPNYARWMSRYLLNLLNAPCEVQAMLEGGSLSVKRTSKPFSRSAVDLTLEQTINKDAASRLTGIAALTQNVNARKRWAVTRPIRGAVVGTLLGMAGISLSEEVSQELKPYRIIRDNKDLASLTHQIETCMNPFKMNPSNTDKLFCLTSGKEASEGVTKDLLNIREMGTLWHHQFIEEWKEKDERFYKPIKRRKIKNFAYDALKMKAKTKDQVKMTEVRCTRDVFGRLLFLAASQRMDLDKVLSYPLTPVPLSLANIDGSINKTDKSALMRKLEAKMTDNAEPNTIQVTIIDAMFLLRTLNNMPQTFGEIAKSFLQFACSFAPTVHIVSDKYSEGPSIKDHEHVLRGEHQAVYTITGSCQQRPKDFSNALQSPHFKTALLKFFSEEWACDKYTSVLSGHTVYFALEQHCYKYSLVDNHVLRNIVDPLACVHDEADTRMIFHLRYIVEESDERLHISVRCCDTDVFVLLLYHSLNLEAGIWMDVGLSSVNSRRLINIKRLAIQLGTRICQALPGFHAFTGCDYCSSFMRKGKVRPMELLLKHTKFISAFTSLRQTEAITCKVVDTIQEFVCCMYGVPKCKDVNEARFLIFRKLCAPKDQNHPLKKIRSSDPCCLPPCKAVLQEKLRRCNFVTYLWKNATMSRATDLEPSNHGWRLNTINKYAPSAITLNESSDTESDSEKQASSDEEEELYMLA